MTDLHKMSRNDLFDALGDLVKNTNVDYYEVFVGDEEPNEIYVKFKGIEENNKEGGETDA